MLNSLRTVVLNEKKRPAVKRCPEASDKCRNDQRRGSRQLEADLKYVDRSQTVYEKEAKRLRQQYENNLAGLKARHSAHFRSKEDKCETVHTVKRRSVGVEHRPPFVRQHSMSKPSEPFFVDETRTAWGVGAVDVSSSFLLSNNEPERTDNGHYPHFRRKCGAIPARSSHRYVTGITTGSRRACLPMHPADLPPRGAFQSGKFNYLTQGKEDLVGDVHNRNSPSNKKLWTPKNEKWKLAGQKVIEQLEFDRRMKRRYIPPGHYKVTDIIIL
jgi:hypothetical protein